MRINSTDFILIVSGLNELVANNAEQVRDDVRSALKNEHTTIEIDLSETGFMDSSGLGILISLHKTMCARNGQIKLVNPSPSTQQILELTRLHRLFEIVEK
jgi:anti-sigma B factor antagonist